MKLNVNGSDIRGEIIGIGKSSIVIETSLKTAVKLLDGIQKNKVYDVEFKQHRKKRSLDANSYAWLLIGKLADVLGKKNTEVYREYIKESSAFNIVPVKEDKIEHWERIWASHGTGWLCEDLGECRNTKGYHNIKSYYGSSVYNSKEMSHLIDMIVDDCKAQGIETETPEEIERLKEIWK